LSLLFLFFLLHSFSEKFWHKMKSLFFPLSWILL
jgi:hypothetical protein